MKKSESKGCLVILVAYLALALYSLLCGLLAIVSNKIYSLDGFGYDNKLLMWLFQEQYINGNMAWWFIWLIGLLVFFWIWTEK